VRLAVQLGGRRVEAQVGHSGGMNPPQTLDSLHV